MSYTRDCTGCSAKITWNDNQKRYEDSLFPGEKHDHKKYEAAAASHVEASNEQFTQPDKGKVDEGKECFVCKKNGFPNEIIFFNNDKLSPSGKHIPLERPDKVNGEYVTHNHKEQGKTQAPSTQPAASKSEEKPVESMSADEMAKAIADFANVGGELLAKLNTMLPKIDTIIGFILDNSVKKADQA